MAQSVDQFHPSVAPGIPSRNRYKPRDSSLGILHPRARTRAAPPLRAEDKIQNFFPLLAMKNRVSPKPVAPPVATRAARRGMVEGPCDDDGDERQPTGGGR